jgi:hypothetical protein
MEPLWQRLGRSLRPRSEERDLVRVGAVSLGTLLKKNVVFDLIDADIQGAEADVFEPAAERLDACVRRVHIGTHSDENEERLRHLFERLGWRCLRDFRNGRTNETPYGQLRFQDGVQTWINTRLTTSDG